MKVTKAIYLREHVARDYREIAGLPLEHVKQRIVGLITRLIQTKPADPTNQIILGPQKWVETYYGHKLEIEGYQKDVVWEGYTYMDERYDRTTVIELYLRPGPTMDTWEIEGYCPYPDVREWYEHLLASIGRPSVLKNRAVLIKAGHFEHNAQNLIWWLTDRVSKTLPAKFAAETPDRLFHLDAWLPDSLMNLDPSTHLISVPGHYTDAEGSIYKQVPDALTFMIKYIPGGNITGDGPRAEVELRCSEQPAVDYASKVWIEMETLYGWPHAIALVVTPEDTANSDLDVKVDRICAKYKPVSNSFRRSSIWLFLKVEAITGGGHVSNELLRRLQPEYLDKRKHDRQGAGGLESEIIVVMRGAITRVRRNEALMRIISSE